jgi:hypothetical protein
MIEERDEKILEAAAAESGFPFDRVERVFALMNEIQAYDEMALKIVDGEVTVGWDDTVGWADGEEPDPIELPQELWDKIADLDFDILGVLPAIERAWLKSYGLPFPTFMYFKKDDKGEMVPTIRPEEDAA